MEAKEWRQRNGDSELDSSAYIPLLKLGEYSAGSLVGKGLVSALDFGQSDVSRAQL